MQTNYGTSNSLTTGILASGADEHEESHGDNHLPQTIALQD